MINELPPEVIEAERTLSLWFAERNIENWQFNKCVSATALEQQARAIKALVDIIINLTDSLKVYPRDSIMAGRALAAVAMLQHNGKLPDFRPSLASPDSDKVAADVLRLCLEHLRKGTQA